MKTLRDYIRYALIAVAILLFVAIITPQVYKFFFGTSLVVTAPEDYATLNKPLILVEGRAKNVSFISLNGRQIFSDEQGFFSEEILLAPGYAIITVQAKAKFNRELTVMRRIVYIPKIISTTTTTTRDIF